VLREKETPQNPHRKANNDGTLKDNGSCICRATRRKGGKKGKSSKDQMFPAEGKMKNEVGGESLENDFEKFNEKEHTNLHQN